MRALPGEKRAQRELSVERARIEWRRAGPIAGTLAQAYLDGRGIGDDVPVSIRFGTVPRYWREDGCEGPRHPAMIAAAQDREGRIVGIQRTFLDANGRKPTTGRRGSRSGECGGARCGWDRSGRRSCWPAPWRTRSRFA